MIEKHNQKIRIIVPIRFPVGGIRTYLKYTYGKLDKDRYQFDFVAPSKVWLNRIKSDLENFNVAVYPTATNKNEIRDLLSMIYTLLESSNYQIIHSQGYTAGILSNIANFVFRVPHIITIHHIFGHGQFSDTFLNRFAMPKRKTIQFLLSFADKIQTVSDDAMTNLLEYFPGIRKKHKKLITIRNGIDINEFLGSYEKSENVFEKDPENIYLGFLGRYMPEKGFPFIIEAMDILVKNYNKNNLRTVSVGGFGGFIREYKKEIKKKGLTDYFIFVDFKEKIAPILKMFDILLIPSLGEACPLVPMEGMICGTPIIAFSCIGLREVLRYSPAIMIPVGDSNGLAEAVLQITDSLAETKKQFIEYIPKAVERFRVEPTAMKLNCVFNELLTKR